MRPHCSRVALLAGTALMPVAAAAQIAPDARPQLDRVVAGGVTIRQDAARTDVNQAQSRGIVDWRQFNVGSGHSVQFQQPDSRSITLNRVTGPDPSTIAGRINANGQIAIVNQSGVVFNQGSQVNAGGLVVSTANISNQSFLAGRMTFDQPGRPDARIENAGTITVRETGLAALVAPQVANHGTINARLGRVALAGAETSVVDLHGDGRLAIEITGPVRQAPANGAALVTNTGMIEATGGTVQLTAAAVDGIVQDLVRAGGRVSADTDAATGRTGRTGRVLVSGTGGAIRIEGEMRAVGTAPGTTGGGIDAIADRVLVDRGARVNASGAAGGGAIGIGTTARGRPTQLARRAGIAEGAEVRADATQRGNGGVVRLDSAEFTLQAGLISARGGPSGGNGGFAEISGQAGLRLTGFVDLAAPAGLPGMLLIDPVDLTIVSDNTPGLDLSETDFVNGVLGVGTLPDNNALLGAGTVNSLAFSGNVRLEASRDIFVNAPLTGAAGNDLLSGSLTLDAGRDIEVNAQMSDFNGLTLNAGSGAIRILNTGSLFDPTAITLFAGNTIAIGGNVFTPGTLDMEAVAGGIAQTAPIGAAVLRLRTGGNAILDYAPPILSEALPNAIGRLDASQVAGNLSLTTASFGNGGLQLGGAIGVGGTLNLRPAGSLLQLSDSVLTVGALDVVTFGDITLRGANRIGQIAELFTGGTIDLLNAQGLLIAGPVRSASLATVLMDVTGDLTVADSISSDGIVTLRASGNLSLTSTGSVSADRVPFITLQAGVDFAANEGSGAVNPDAASALSLAGVVSAPGGSVVLGAGRGGIQQGGGRIETDFLEVRSGGDALLTSQANAASTLIELQAAGNFALDNGTTNLDVITGQEGDPGTAATIGLRSAGTIRLARGTSLVAPGGAGRISINAGTLVVEPASSGAASVVEIAPYSATPVTLPVIQPLGSGFELTATDLAAFDAQTLRIGATSFGGTLATTADGIRFVDTLAFAGTLELRSLSTIGQNVGANLVVGTLTGAAGGAVTLTEPANALGALADFASGGPFSLQVSGPLNLVGHLDAPGQPMSLTATGGGVLAGTAGRISSGSLSVATAGPIELTGANAVGAISGLSAAGGIRFANTTDLALTGPISAPRAAVQLTVVGRLSQTGGGITAASLTGSATAGATFDAANLIPVLDGFDAGTGDLRFNAAVPLLTIPGGRTIAAGGALAVLAPDALLVDGTVSGTTTDLTAGTALTVNGFSAIARGGSLSLTAPNVRLNGLASAAADIVVNATTVSLAGQAQTSNTLVVNASSASFGGLDARSAQLRLDLGASGSATGAVDARGLTVLGGRGVVLAGTLAGVGGPVASVLGRRATATGILLGDPPPNAADFTFNGCPIGTILCAGAVGFTFANPNAVQGVLDPLNLVPFVVLATPSLPPLSVRPARDLSEEADLAPPDIRAGDF